MAPENRHTHPNYSSGEDYILEFRSFRYGFNSVDFAQRVEMAAVELGLVEPGMLRHDECADLVQLVAGGSIEFPVSSLGEYLLERGDDVLTLARRVPGLLAARAGVPQRLARPAAHRGPARGRLRRRDRLVRLLPHGASLAAHRSSAASLVARGGIHPLTVA